MAPAPSCKKPTKKPFVEKSRANAKGTKPLPDQASVSYILSLFAVHACRKVLLLQVEVKLMFYSLTLFFGSLLFDFLTIPKMYLGYKDNIFNTYFVKFGWGWTLLVVGAFIYMTTITYGCGRLNVTKRHLLRLIVGTFIWFICSQWFFPFIESTTGVCLGKTIIKDKWTCDNYGFQWRAFDISGHAFLLIYMNLILVEEARAIAGWEGIQDLVRAEDHYRNRELGAEDGMLKHLKEAEFSSLKRNYERWTPYIRGTFIGMTLMSLLSDVMLIATILYFHTMPQKVVGGGLAISAWFITYRLWYRSEFSPGLPGNGGPFRYQHLRDKANEGPNRRRSSLCKDHTDIPMFMGMPITGLKRDQEDKKKDEDKTDEYGEKKSKYGADTRNRIWNR